MKTFCLIFLFWLLLAGNVYAANNSTEWPYGGKTHPFRGMSLEKGELFRKAWLTFPDSVDFSTKLFRKNALFPQTIFSKNVTFSDAIFSANADFSFTQFTEYINFYRAHFRKKADFSYTSYGSSPDMKKVVDKPDVFFQEETNTDFSQAHFLEEANFSFSFFHKKTSFFHTEFAKDTHYLFTIFAGKTGFMDTNFAGDADFRYAKFLSDVDFSNTDSKDYPKSFTVFKQQANFKSVTFNGYTNFALTQFAQNANFSNATFSRMANFSDATFSGYANFENCQFLDKVKFSGTQFIQGVDLRRADFNKTNSTLIDHHTFFPNGKLNVNWNQIKGRLHLSEESCINASPWQMAKREYHELDSLYNRVAHKNISNTPDTLAIKRQNVKARLDSLTQVFNKERYDLTEIFYLRLRDNYLAQNNKASADAVMYELAERKADILNEPLWILYGWIMGWGYKPVQFLLAAFLLVALPFALFWYRRYYHLVLPMVDHAIDDAFKEQLKAPENLNKKNHFNHAAIAGEIIFPARVWHVIFFSTSVLLGIRFKKEWIEKKDRAFLWWVTAEWLIGIGLYILFAVLVKSNEFSYVKGLLGLS
ncbi:MAG: pentapeptide repeat-containing protein [Chlorobium sp.]